MELVDVILKPIVKKLKFFGKKYPRRSMLLSIIVLCTMGGLFIKNKFATRNQDNIGSCANPSNAGNSVNQSNIGNGVNQNKTVVNGDNIIITAPKGDVKIDKTKNNNDTTKNEHELPI